MDRVKATSAASRENVTDVPPDVPLSPKTVERVKRENSATVAVIDPEGPNTGVYTIFLPWESVFETQGLQRLLNEQKPHPSLCMLFQNRKCRAGTKCNQVHAFPSVVIDVRAEGRHDCCLRHNDPPSKDKHFLDSYAVQKGELLLVTNNKKRFSVPWDALARTACLDKLLDKKGDGNRPLKFMMPYVCRLHQLEKCRYGQDCHHIHVCRAFWSKLMELYPNLIEETETAKPLAEVSCPSAVQTNNSRTVAETKPCNFKGQLAAADHNASPQPQQRISSHLPPIKATSVSTPLCGCGCKTETQVADTISHKHNSFTVGSSPRKTTGNATNQSYLASSRLPPVELHTKVESHPSSASNELHCPISFGEFIPQLYGDFGVNRAQGIDLQTLLHHALRKPPLKEVVSTDHTFRIPSASPPLIPECDEPCSLFSEIYSVIDSVGSASGVLKNGAPKGAIVNCPVEDDSPFYPCVVIVEKTGLTMQVPIDKQHANSLTLSDLRKRIFVEKPFVFVVDRRDVISPTEERFVRVCKLNKIAIRDRR